MKISNFLLLSLPAVFALYACSTADNIVEDDWNPDDIYMAVDMDSPQSRVSYHLEPNYFDDGNLAARWEIGDIIKVYEAVDDDGTLTDVYSSYKEYEDYNEFPAAPVIDKYYRFECVGGEGTTHGIFKYIGVATVTVVGGIAGVDDGLYNVNLDVTYNQKINNWHEFDGVVIYGNPLRNYMMRHQEKNGDFCHLKYGQRMKGHLCNYNFANWSNPVDNSYGNTEGFVLYNTASCVFKIILDGFEDDIYGGATLTLSMPGVTDGHEHTSSSKCFRTQPMSLTLGNVFDHQELQKPWCYSKDTSVLPEGGTNKITVYVVGWPGTVPKGKNITVTLEDRFYGKSYTWTLSKDEDIVFEEDYYYTFDLTGGRYPVKIVTDENLQTTP